MFEGIKRFSKLPPGAWKPIATGAATIALTLLTAEIIRRRPSKSAESLDPKPSRSAPREDLPRGHGRFADAPEEIPPRGWKDILVRTAKEVADDNITLVAAGVTFYVILAIFPALVSFVSLYGLIADVNDVPKHLSALVGIIPLAVLDFLGAQMTRLALARPEGLSWTMAIGFVISLWSANSAAKAMFLGLNIAYEEREKRGFIRLNLASLGFTFGLIVLFAALSALLVAAPTIIATDVTLPNATAWLRWPVEFAVLLLGLAILYRFGPSRTQPRWRWVTWGSAIAALLLMAVSALFSFYVAHVARFEAVYGPLAAGVGLFIWLYWSAVIVLIGAELNAEMEHQTIVDSTIGAPAPMGERGARMADTIGTIAR